MDGDDTSQQEKDYSGWDASDDIDDVMNFNHTGERNAGETPIMDITIDSGASKVVAPLVRIRASHQALGWI